MLRPSTAELFDRGRATSLLLLNMCGESRDRGQAMVDLLAQYEQHGLRLNSHPCPDHLPLYLGIWRSFRKAKPWRFERYCADSGIAERASATA